ncbi:hypothetical protein B0A55_07585 [Friedmanniomyces simplex]|uniref:Zinc finger PHD-type domain-containing protein n=1 Tax=Friedmanniomyces simplex TaxID=329884 RepID=A0A4U0X2U0_9PEZI|nr:hypothetical protein B0A55_07585 [Friedmanniomyces simplex]
MQAVLGLEIGTVLNEHYSLQEYVNRRAGWLGRLPYYAGMLAGLFAIARRDATKVFKSDHALSVQEVRRREHAAEVDPLLPLPTTNNTETLDHFQSYGQREWSPGVVWPEPRVSVSDEEEDADAALNTLGATLPSVRSSGMSQTARRTNSPSQRQTEHLTADLGIQSAQTGRLSLVQPANIQQTIESGPIRRPHHRSSDPSTIFQPASSSPMATVASTPATTPMSASSALHLPPSHTVTSRPELIRGILDRLGTPSAKSPTSVHVNRDISALAGRGMHVPVKQKRGTKRAASEPPEANDSGVGSPVNEATPPPPAQPPRKRIKLIGPRDPSRSPPKAASRPEEALKVRKSKPTNRKPSSPAKITKQASPVNRKNGEAAPSALEPVIAGTRLPENKAEAKQAALLRHECRLAQHRATSPPHNLKTKSRATHTTQANPDLLPEFFNPENFAPGQEEDSVRCVCGAITDDGADMVSCDECMVWQHTRCMGEGVPRNLTREKYFCHVCSPWTHRRLIARLRKGRVVGGD